MLKGIVRTAAPEGVDSLTVEVNFGIAIRERLLPVYQANYDQLLDQLGDWQQKRNEAEDEADLVSAQTEIKQALYNAYDPLLPNGEINPDWAAARDELIELLTELSELRATQAAYQREVDITFNAWLKSSAALNDIQSWETQPLIQAEKPHELEEFLVGDECTVYFQNDTTGLRVFASGYRRDSFLGQFADFGFLTPEQSYYFRALQPYQERYKPICRTGRIIRPVGGTFSDYTIAEVQLTPAQSSANNQLSINHKTIAVCRSHGVNLHGFAGGDEVVVVLDADFEVTGKGTIISYKEPNLFIKCIPIHKGQRVRTFAFSYHNHNDRNRAFPDFSRQVVKSDGGTGDIHFNTREYTNVPSPDIHVGYRIYAPYEGQEFTTGTLFPNTGIIATLSGSWRPTPSAEWQEAHPLFGALPYSHKFNGEEDIDGAVVTCKYGTLYETGPVNYKGALFCSVAHTYIANQYDPSDPANGFYPMFEIRHIPVGDSGKVSAPITSRRWNRTYVGTSFRFGYVAILPNPDSRVNPSDVYGPLLGDWPTVTLTYSSGKPYEISMTLPTGEVV